MTDPRSDAERFYDANLYRLRRLEEVTLQLVQEVILDAGIYSHQVTSRHKTRQSYQQKASKLRADGSLKYTDPVGQITDLVGVRVVVPIGSDVPGMAVPICSAFDVIEDVKRGNEAYVDRPGYQSRHLVVRLRPETLDARREPELGTDITIEIQIRSILQDALASFEHDLAYKAETEPTPAIRRRLVEIASLLQVADRLFTQVRDDALAEVENTALIDEEQADTAAHEWTDSALQQLLESVVGDTEADPLAWLRELRNVLEQLGYRSPDELRDLTSDLSGGPGLALRLRKNRPWLTGTQIFDLLLRSKLGASYFDRRHAGLDQDLLPAARVAFDLERQQIDAYLTEMV